MRREDKAAYIQKQLDAYREEYGSVEEFSDGYHTFKELYDHRIQLWIATASQSYNLHHAQGNGKNPVWRSKNHSDGKPAFGGGWMVLGIGYQFGTQITYHLPESYWAQCDFATSLDKAPAFDGHTSQDVLERLKSL